MSWVPAVPKEKWSEVAASYLSGLPMREVAQRFSVSIDAVVYVLRKTRTPRRSFSEASHITFANKKPSFSLRKGNSRSRREMELMGATLYWAEGYKTAKATGIDFANSDPDMAQLFLRFLRTRYVLDLSRLYCQIYYYTDQNIGAITAFWAQKLDMPQTAFRSPYAKQNPKPTAKKLPYGVVHIRYSDKKLLWDVLNLIKSCKVEFCVGG